MKGIADNAFGNQRADAAKTQSKTENMPELEWNYGERRTSLPVFVYLRFLR
jgi:hypothetical protein